MNRLLCELALVISAKIVFNLHHSRRLNITNINDLSENYSAYQG